MADKVHGTVWVDAVVLPDGSVGDVCVTKSLHDDLDVEALARRGSGSLRLACEGANQWRFWSRLNSLSP
jgi:hypothetical protein